jgi:hypothetical protein
VPRASPGGRLRAATKPASPSADDLSRRRAPKFTAETFDTPP